MRILLSQHSLASGDILTVTAAEVENVGVFGQMQVEIFDTGSRNPSAKFGIGSQFDLSGQGDATISIPLRDIASGIYEIKLVMFHQHRTNPVERAAFESGLAFERQFFEIRQPDSVALGREQIAAIALEKERLIEREFLAPIDIREQKDIAGIDFAALVFLNGLLVGTRFRLDNCEVVPTGTGLDATDPLNFVNEFIGQRMTVEQAFPYDDKARQDARRDQPVCVVHFPGIIAVNVADVVRYCRWKTEVILLALSLLRGASGEAFQIVIFDKQSGNAARFGRETPYSGNALTGNLAGENAESVEMYSRGLTVDPFNGFLVGLFKQALAEDSLDFRYARLFQILEILADRRNYDEGLDMVGFAGEVMRKDDGQPRKQKGAAESVFCLLRDEQYGNTESAWRNANVWFAFRSAVMHYGAVARFEDLSRENVKQWARQAANEIAAAGHDHYIWELKECVKLLLMRLLVSTASRE